jgi:hypothetical protein
MKLTYDELKQEIDKIEVPKQRLGIFNVSINNKGKKYYFEKLKQNFGASVGFGLNHYGWTNLAKQAYKHSKFHDSEDVCIDIDESEFISCEKNENEFIIKTKNFDAVVSWS